MSRLAAAMIRTKPAPNRWPETVTFDFDTLQFIRPTGVVFLHNLIRWLQAKDCTVSFRNHKKNRPPLNYLRDARFFSTHINSYDMSGSVTRSTTKALVEVRHSASHAWIRRQLIPWISSESGADEASLYGLRSCFSELFNNIRDHTRHDIGSVFAQHFPHEHSIIISLSDMGIGIPRNVRKVRRELGDGDCIVEAVKCGFTTGSVPTNAGMGLDQLLQTVVTTLNGRVSIYSGKGMVAFEQRIRGIGSKR